MADYLTSVKKLSERLGLIPEYTTVNKPECDDVFSPFSDVVIKVTPSTSSSTSDDDVSDELKALMMKRGAKRSLTSTKSLPLAGAQLQVQENQMEKRLSNVKAMLDIINVEMMAMRRSDQDIAKQFLQIYSEIKELKVKQSCLQHMDLLDQAAYESEMADEVPDVCDVPTKRKNTMLSNLGVTWMNINARRFSCS